MNETINVKVRLPNRTVLDCVVKVSRNPCRLIFSGPEMQKSEFSKNDLFDALIALRKELGKMGCQILCAGARVDVFPSGMGRDMGRGRKAYVLRLGQPATELLDIFEYAPPEMVGSVEQQRAFHTKWVESLKARHLELEAPLPGEIEEARRHPNGWVYRIVGSVDPNGPVPPEAVIGAWKVDANGEIVGAFIKNKNYDLKRWTDPKRWQ
jgi:hypothetical protein